MKLIDALKLVDRSEQNEGSLEWFHFIESLSINVYNVPNDFYERVKTYWVMKWLCTDTWVGLQAIYLDGELVGMIWQPARKGEVDFQFVSAEVARKIRDYILSANPVTEFSLINMDEDISGTYNVAYGSQLLVTAGLYNGKPVTVINESIVRGHKEPVDEWSRIMVRDEAGNEFKIDLEDFHIPINITDKK